MRTLVNVALFQVGWFASVLGAAHDYPYLGPIVVGLTLVVHLRWFGTRREWLLVLTSAALGTVAESILVLTGFVSYRADPLPLWLCPPWITAMWANFALTLRHSLRFLEGRWALAALLGAVAGPLAYVAGSRLEAIDLCEPIRALLALTGIWASALGLLTVASYRSSSAKRCVRVIEESRRE